MTPHPPSVDTISRRTVLRRGAVASAVGLTGLSVSGGAVADQHCDLTVDADGTGDHQTIQAAVDAAIAGETICVRGGTYAEHVSVDEPVTVAAATDPDGPDAAVVGGSVTVSASGATVEGLRVAPSTTFEPDGLDPHGILVTGVVDGVTIAGNVVAGMTADNEGGSVTLNAIQLWNDGPGWQTDTVVRDNAVRNMDNDGAPGWPNYGGAAAVKVQGLVDGASVTGNHVASVHSAGWTYGVVTTHTANAPGVSSRNTTVRWNTLEEINDGSVYDVFDDTEAAPYPGSAVAVDGDSLASELTATFNDLLDTPHGAQNKDTANTLDATCNYWDHATGPDTGSNQRGQGAGVLGDVDHDPWSVRSIAHGRNHGRSCVGGTGGGPAP